MLFSTQILNTTFLIFILAPKRGPYLFAYTLQRPSQLYFILCKTFYNWRNMGYRLAIKRLLFPFVFLDETLELLIVSLSKQSQLFVGSLSLQTKLIGTANSRLMLFIPQLPLFWEIDFKLGDMCLWRIATGLLGMAGFFGFTSYLIERLQSAISLVRTVHYILLIAGFLNLNYNIEIFAGFHWKITS